MSLQTLNEVQILDDILLYKNKLAGMKDHLETLLRKRIRIDSEIKVLKKAIQNKEKTFALKIKTSAKLESCNEPIEVHFLPEKIAFGIPEGTPQEIESALVETCLLSQDIETLIQEFEQDV